MAGPDRKLLGNASSNCWHMPHVYKQLQGWVGENELDMHSSTWWTIGVREGAPLSGVQWQPPSSHIPVIRRSQRSMVSQTGKKMYLTQWKCRKAYTFGWITQCSSHPVAFKRISRAMNIGLMLSGITLLLSLITEGQSNFMTISLPSLLYRLEILQ